MAWAQVATIRLKLFGIGAVTRRNTGPVQLRLSSIPPASSSQFVYLAPAFAA